MVRMKVTDYLAIYGALLSTAVAFWNAQRAKSKIRVLLTFAIDTFEGKTQSGLGISVQNPSAHSVHITDVSFLYPLQTVSVLDRFKHMLEFKRLPRHQGWCHTSLSNYQVEDSCPATIEPGQSHWIFVPSEALERLFTDVKSRRLKAVVQDALWRNKYSKEFEYPTPRHGEG